MGIYNAGNIYLELVSTMGYILPSTGYVKWFTHYRLALYGGRKRSKDKVNPFAELCVCLCVCLSLTVSVSLSFPLPFLFLLPLSPFLSPISLNEFNSVT